ncbi:MAG: beta-hydroxyacyl-ACP dehydratase [bacterium]|nr:beta-hydroxyacyl-ACP dehydratase [bacterium]
MGSKELLVDLNAIDLDNVVATIDEIRQINPQRHEMEQINAIIYACEETNACVGYKDVTEDEFWVRGHMPGMPLMPGVVMIEAMAQLCAFFVQKFDLLGSDMVGLGGLENVRFRGPVRPGDRLYLLTKLQKIRRGRMIVSKIQGVVNGTLVVDGEMKGIPLPLSALKNDNG